MAAETGAGGDPPLECADVPSGGSGGGEVAVAAMAMLDGGRLARIAAREALSRSDEEEEEAPSDRAANDAGLKE